MKRLSQKVAITIRSESKQSGEKDSLKIFKHVSNTVNKFNDCIDYVLDLPNY